MPAKRKNGPYSLRKTKKRIKKTAPSLRTTYLGGKVRSLKPSRSRGRRVGKLETYENLPVKMRKAPKGWIAAKAVRIVKRGGKTIVEVKR